MDRFGCWIVVLVPSIQERISSAFVMANIETSPLSASGKICSTNDDSTIIGHTLAFKLRGNYKTSEEMFNKVKDVLRSSNVDYISLIVTMNHHGSKWDVSTHKKENQQVTFGDGGPYRTMNVANE